MCRSGVKCKPNSTRIIIIGYFGEMIMCLGILYRAIRIDEMCRSIENVSRNRREGL